MRLFPDWLLQRHLGLTLDADESAMLVATETALVASALEQPVVFVHRDYHSRNLMRVADHNPGVIDFQDAVAGPVTYDLVSLLRDCYVRWPEGRVETWLADYLKSARREGLVTEVSDVQFRRWFDLMGVQRHLKAAGIFARLNHRDGKPGYLDDLPRTLGYVAAIGERHDETRALAGFVANRVLPLL
jgi:aminoglycoside/choline kinase family phosphotransferase